MYEQLNFQALDNYRPNRNPNFYLIRTKTTRCFGTDYSNIDNGRAINKFLMFDKYSSESGRASESFSLKRVGLFFLCINILSIDDINKCVYVCVVWEIESGADCCMRLLHAFNANHSVTNQNKFPLEITKTTSSRSQLICFVYIIVSFFPSSEEQCN